MRRFVCLVFVLLLAGCAGSSSSGDHAPRVVRDEARGLLITVAPIEAAWDGIAHHAGTGEASLRWEGPGEAHLESATLSWGEASNRTEYGMDSTLREGESVPLRVTGGLAASEGTLVVRGRVGGEPFEVRAVVTSVPNRERVAAMEACAARQGSFGPRGLSGRELCDAPTADGGRPCLSSSECETACIATGVRVLGTEGCAAGEEQIQLEGRCFERTVTLGGCRAYLDAPAVSCRPVGHGSRLPIRCGD
ncbi:MAG: hypothetical protein J0L92_17450 [Deltaproteobacteria bacterium]|nr:hypothetical protein [Deltaproteobacteria bacterium]